MKNIIIILTLSILTLSGCQPFPWCEALSLIKKAVEDTDIVIVESPNPYNVWASPRIIDDKRIAIQFRRPKDQAFCVEYLAFLDQEGIYQQETILDAFKPENAIFLFTQDIGACELPDPGRCMVD